ncbi:hypothetical protein ACTXT7_004650 [Hymenolepis weldensis]
MAFLLSPYRSRDKDGQRRADYNSLATQLSNNADMEARISLINAFTQMNFSTSTKDPKDYMKNTQYRDIYKNIMADLPHATRITMLLCEFNGSDHHLCSSYFQPMDPADVTYEKMISIVNRLCTIAETKFSQDSALTYHSGPTKGATCTTMTIAHSKGSNVILLWPSTSRSAISILSIRNAR